MIRYTSITKYALLLTLITGTYAYSQQAEATAPVAQPTKQETEVFSGNDYVAHILTGAASNIAALVSVAAGAVAGQVALVRNPSGDISAIYLSSATPILLGSIAGLYIIYKTPQWTDTNLLEKKKERTTKQNIIVFLNRILLSWPLGVVTGEYFIH